MLSSIILSRKLSENLNRVLSLEKEKKKFLLHLNIGHCTYEVRVSLSQLYNYIYYYTGDTSLPQAEKVKKVGFLLNLYKLFLQDTIYAMLDLIMQV